MQHQNLPSGLVMALAHNPKAMVKFATLPEEKRQEIITQTHSMQSKKEMQSLVNGLVTE